MNILKERGLYYKRRRKEKHLLQKDVAEQIGSSVQTIRNFENGVNRLSDTYFVPLTLLLDIELSKIPR